MQSNGHCTALDARLPGSCRCCRRMNVCFRPLVARHCAAQGLAISHSRPPTLVAAAQQGGEPVDSPPYADVRAPGRQPAVRPPVPVVRRGRRRSSLPPQLGRKRGPSPSRSPAVPAATPSYPQEQLEQLAPSVAQLDQQQSQQQQLQPPWGASQQQGTSPTLPPPPAHWQPQQQSGGPQYPQQQGLQYSPYAAAAALHPPQPAAQLQALLTPPPQPLPQQLRPWQQAAAPSAVQDPALTQQQQLSWSGQPLPWQQQPWQQPLPPPQQQAWQEQQQQQQQPWQEGQQQQQQPWQQPHQSHLQPSLQQQPWPQAPPGHQTGGWGVTWSDPGQQAQQQESGQFPQDMLQQEQQQPEQQQDHHHQPLQQQQQQQPEQAPHPQQHYSTPPSAEQLQPVEAFESALPAVIQPTLPPASSSHAGVQQQHTQQQQDHHHQQQQQLQREQQQQPEHQQQNMPVQAGASTMGESARLDNLGSSSSSSSTEPEQEQSLAARRRKRSTARTARSTAAASVSPEAPAQLTGVEAAVEEAAAAGVAGATGSPAPAATSGASSSSSGSSSSSLDQQGAYSKGSSTNGSSGSSPESAAAISIAGDSSNGKSSGSSINITSSTGRIGSTTSSGSGSGNGRSSRSSTESKSSSVTGGSSRSYTGSVSSSGTGRNTRSSTDSKSSSVTGGSSRGSTGSSSSSSSNGSSSSQPPPPPAAAGHKSWALLTAISRGQRAAAAGKPPKASKAGASASKGQTAAAGAAAAPGRSKAAARVEAAPSSTAGSSKGAKAGDVVQVGPGAWKLVGYEDELADWQQLTPPLQERLRAAIQAEQLHEAAALKALYAPGNLGRLQREGLVLVGLVATPHSLLYSSMVWGLTAGGGRELGYHRFRPGDGVLLSRWTGERPGGSQHPNPPTSTKPDPKAALDATVVEVTKGGLTIALDKADSDHLREQLEQGHQGANSWRLDQSVRDTTARRQLDAVNRLHTLADPSSPFETLVRCALVGSRSTAAVAQMPPAWVRDPAWREDVRGLLAAQGQLNNSQRRAVATALLRSVTLWQGPPGTGKTRTLLALIRVLAAASGADGERWRRTGAILACGDTNAAVDNLVEGLAGAGLGVVRLGAVAKVRPSVRHLALEALAGDTPQGRQAAALRESSRKLLDAAKAAATKTTPGTSPPPAAAAPLVPSSRSRSSAALRRKGGAYQELESPQQLEARAKREWAAAEALSKAAAAQVLEEAQVVVATCSGAGDAALGNRSFRMVVIDEASQATEPAVLVPLIRGAQCVVMAGDPRQLPPTILSREAVTSYGLDVTLFERLVGRGLEPLLLDTQYRMHPAISAWPSAWFYRGKLQDGVSAAQKPPAAGFPWPAAGTLGPVALVEVAGREERATKQQRRGGGTGGDAQVGPPGGGGGAPAAEEASYRNLQEARVAVAAMYALLTAGDAETGAILTPYRGQARALEHALRTLSPWWEELQAAGRLAVSSVDAFQGREADVVVLTTVRCNSRGAVGFVADPRRLNVAVTRPRRGLVVVGHPRTLAAGSADWAGYLGWLEAQGAVMTAGGVPVAPWVEAGRDPFEQAPALESSG